MRREFLPSIQFIHKEKNDMTNTSATLDVKESKELLTPTDLDQIGRAHV